MRASEIAVLTRSGRHRLGLRYPRLQSVWARLNSPLTLVRRRRDQRLQDAYLARFGAVVRQGPFAGLVYPDAGRDFRHSIVPVLLGSFESELHPVLAKVVEHGYGTVINIGSGNGLYAVGLARALPRATAHAFEASPRRRALTAELARANGVAERVRIHGSCDVAALRSLEVSSPFVICDCEGCEVDLLDVDAVPSLRSATILVELHDLFRPGATDALLGRFASSHDVSMIQSRRRDPAEYEELRTFGRRDAARLVGERRPGPMRWAYLKPQRTRSTG